jgi:hypothetical protein
MPGNIVFAARRQQMASVELFSWRRVSSEYCTFARLGGACELTGSDSGVQLLKVGYGLSIGIVPVREHAACVCRVSHTARL